MSPKPTRPFNTLLTPEQYEQLQTLAEITGHSMGQIVRDCLKRAYIHTACHVPTCANGNSCFVPQMHAKPAVDPKPLIS